MEHLTFAVQKAGPMRTETLMGREFRVFPAVLVREQVLHNNLGRTFLPAEEIERSADAWNSIPVVIRHPTSRGAPVSARSPEVLNARGVGFLFRARYEAAALKADVFLDNMLVASVEGADVAVTNVETGIVTELSTGFGTQVERTPGKYNGAEFDVILRNIDPDHLALLPDEVGACSVMDGCGLGINHAGVCAVEKGSFEESLTISDAANSGVEVVVKSRDPVRALSRLTDAIESIKGRIQSALGLEPPEVVSGGEPVAKHEPAANAGDLSQEAEAMSKEQMIAHLAEKGTPREALAALSECQLKALMGVGQTPDAEPQGDGWGKATEYRQKYEDLLRETANARESEQKERTRLLDDLLFNVRHLPYTETEVKAMDIVQLRKVHALAFPNRPDYTGRGGPRAQNVGPTFDFVRPILDGGAGDSVLDRKEAN